MVSSKNILFKISQSCFCIFLFIFFSCEITQAQENKTKIACVGNSVTYGYGLKEPNINSYPALLQQKLGTKYEVRNFGHSGATLLRKGHNPYFKTKAFADMLLFHPDLVIIHLGLNDTDPRDFPNYRDEFIPDYSWLIDTIRKTNSNTKIFVCSLTPIFSGHPRFVSSTFDWYWDIQNKIKEVASIHQLQIIDLHTALFNHPDLFPDQLHPNEDGAVLLANTVYQNITGDFGGLKMPDIFTDNMVLQRNEPIRVWGKANAGSLVTIKFLNIKKSEVVGADGKWEIIFPATKATSQSQTLEISNNNSTLYFKNILIGDVWLCSGQSNMYFSVKESADADSILQKADADLPLRLFKYKPLAETDTHIWTAEELQHANDLNFFSGKWQLNNKENVADFSAVAHAFGSAILREEKVPIGLIELAVGGAPLISWVSRLSLESSPLFVQSFKNWTKSDFIMQWCRERATLNMKEATNPLQRHSYEPSYNFEAGVSKIIDFPIKGVIWYQGESDAENAELYEKLFPLFVRDWRKQWNKDLPFYYVQLSSIERPSWNYFRDAQRKMLYVVPNSGMAVSSDLGDKINVHPKQKAPIGERLARLALKNTYHKMITASGPLFSSATKNGNQIEVSFTNANGLKTADKQIVRGFELLDNKGIFVNASAIIKNDKIIIRIPKNLQVEKVAYAWQPYTNANLVNKDNLPASTFIENIK